jgi:hypothetical protein
MGLFVVIFLAIEPKKSWQILYNLPRRWAGLPADPAVAGEENSQHTIWLAWQSSFRTFDWLKELADPATIINQTRQLLALV